MKFPLGYRHHQESPGPLRVSRDSKVMIPEIQEETMDELDLEVSSITDSIMRKEEASKRISQLQVPQWSVGEVMAWVTSHKFPATVINSFQEAQVDGDLLLLMTEKNLKEDLNMTNGIHRKRFLRELNNLKKEADYTSVDKNNLARFLERNVGPEYRVYTYNLVKHDLSLDLMRRLSESDLNDMLMETDISSSIHRKKIIDAVLDDNNSLSTPLLYTPRNTCVLENNNVDVYFSYDRLCSAELASLIMMQLQMRGFNVHTASDSQGHHENGLKIIGNVSNFVLIISGQTLEHSNELMRKEIAAALNANCNIIPVLDDVNMPAMDALPADISAVTKFNAVRWIHDYQDACLEKIERFIQGEKFLVVDSTGRQSSGRDSGLSTPSKLLTPIMARRERIRTISADSAIMA